jgi:hypothetical protein
MYTIRANHKDHWTLPQPVFRICDILVWIRILGPVHLLIDPDPALDPAIFVSDFQDANKEFFFSIFFSYCFLHCRYIFQPSKIKSHKEVTKQQKSRFFHIFCLLMEGSGSVQIITDTDPGGLKTYESNGSGSGSGKLTETFLHDGLAHRVK